jgi:hypothetical protein
MQRGRRFSTDYMASAIRACEMGNMPISQARVRWVRSESAFSDGDLSRGAMA